MPEAELLVADEVILTASIERLLSKHGHRVTCMRCGEEIINEREVMQEGELLCVPCATNSYYNSVEPLTLFKELNIIGL